MSQRIKSMLMMFADYGICLLLQILGIFVLSLVESFSWGYPLYSALFCLVIFIFHYVRAHKAGRRIDAKRSLWEGLIIALPLALFHLLIIGGFALLSSDLTPWGDTVIKTVYTFPDNAPRVATDVVLLEYAEPAVRLWFSPIVGFIREKTNAFVLLIVPALTLSAGFLGYLAAQKKFYFSEHFAAFSKKVADKFNE